MRETARRHVRETTELLISPDDDYVLVVIPPGVWHGFQGVADPVSIFANCATEPSDPDELDRLEPLIPRSPIPGRGS